MYPTFECTYQSRAHTQSLENAAVQDEVATLHKLHKWVFLFTNGWGNFQVYEATYLHVCTLIIANLAPFSEDTKQLYNFWWTLS